MKDFLPSVEKQLRYYKSLAERAIVQIDKDEIFRKEGYHQNSIAILMQHLAGNMISRWTDLFDSDGEKEWRNRDQEFEPVFSTREGIVNYWDEGWEVLFSALENMHEHDLSKVIYIRAMGHTVVEAIQRQLCHYSYHIGQIVFLAKQIKGDRWHSLSIPLGDSDRYNKDKMRGGKRRSHFTDDL